MYGTVRLFCRRSPWRALLRDMLTLIRVLIRASYNAGRVPIAFSPVTRTSCHLVPRALNRAGRRHSAARYRRLDHPQPTRQPIRLARAVIIQRPAR